MTGGAGLERGYRRLLACFPRRFRDEHGEELLAVLLASAQDGQHRPGLLESADLVRNGLGMRLHPDNSRSARQGWSDALAALALSVAFLWLGAGRIPGLGWIVSLNLETGLSVYLLEAVALIASPGPRHGRRLVHWGHWAVLPAAVAAQACLFTRLFMPYRGRGSMIALGFLVILIFAVNRLGQALRLSRSFRLLLAATFYPTVFLAATQYLGGLRLLIDLSDLAYPAQAALIFAGPLLCAAVALGTAIRPRRRRII